MSFIDNILSFDQQLLLQWCGSDSLYMDRVMMHITSTATWIPAAIALLYVIIKNNSARNIFLILGMFALVIVLADGISSGICKPLFARFRPSNDPIIMYDVDVVDGYRGGKYGFISSHAANTFSTFVFFALLFRSTRLTVMMLFWSLANCYSRIYLSVHYPLDIACGLLCGAAVGLAVYYLYSVLYLRFCSTDVRFVSDKYTSSGYVRLDLLIIELAVALCFLYSLVAALVF